MARTFARFVAFLERHVNVGAYVFAAVIGLSLGLTSYHANTHRVRDLEAVVAAQAQDRRDRCDELNERFEHLGDGIERLIGLAANPVRMRAALGPILDATTPVDCSPTKAK